MRSLQLGLYVGLLSAGSLLSTSASAADRVASEPHVVVQYADLDLNKPQGVETLYGRIENAATRLCTDSGWRRLDERVKERECVAHTISDTVAKIQNRQLAALYKQRTGNPG